MRRRASRGATWSSGRSAAAAPCIAAPPRGETPLGTLALTVPGRHNLQNALAAVAVAGELGIDFAAVAATLRDFHGAERRFERLGEADGVLVVDDYGHHPTEIAAVLAAAHVTLGRRLVVAFQPHRYTRTEQLMREFGPAFADADEVVLTDIYAASEEPIPGVTVEALAESRRAAATGRPVRVVNALDASPASSRTRRSRATPCSRSAPARSQRCRSGSWRRCAPGRRAHDAGVAAPSDKRFRRAHVSPTRKRWRPRGRPRPRGRRPGRGGVGRLRRTRPRSCSRPARSRVAHHRRRQRPMSRGEVMARLDGLEGAHMLTVDLEAWRQRLRTSPWVADAALRRVFPGTVMVVISEREPMGIGRLDDRLMLVDAEGTIIDEFGPNYADARPAHHRRARVAGAPASLVDGERAMLASRRHCRRCSNSPSWRAWCRRSTSATLRDAAVLLEERHRRAHGRRRPVRRTAAVVPRAGAGAARARRRTSTTWTCGSTSACTCARQGRRQRTSGRRTSVGRTEEPVARKERYVVGLDVGTSNVSRASSARASTTAACDIVGIGVADRAASSAASSSTSRRRSTRSRRRSRKPS